MTKFQISCKIIINLNLSCLYRKILPGFVIVVEENLKKCPIKAV